MMIEWIGLGLSILLATLSCWYMATQAGKSDHPDREFLLGIFGLIVSLILATVVLASSLSQLFPML